MKQKDVKVAGVKTTFGNITTVGEMQDFPSQLRQSL